MAEEQKDLEDELLNAFLESNVSSKSYRGPAKDYMESDLRKNKYEKLASEDDTLADFLRTTYGSPETFLEFNPDLVSKRIYNPGIDYNVEVEILTEDDNYTSNFISSTEAFFEILGGVCTIQYYKVDGRADQMTITLKRDIMPSSQHETRLDAFKGMGGQKLLVWNLQKEQWASFYMRNLIRFVRDDTTGLQ